MVWLAALLNKACIMQVPNTCGMCADRDFFMSAKEAVDYGLIDGVISKPTLMASQQGNGASQ